MCWDSDVKYLPGQDRLRARLRARWGTTTAELSRTGSRRRLRRRGPAPAPPSGLGGPGRRTPGQTTRLTRSAQLIRHAGWIRAQEVDGADTLISRRLPELFRQAGPGRCRHGAEGGYLPIRALTPRHPSWGPNQAARILLAGAPREVAKDYARRHGRAFSTRALMIGPSLGHDSSLRGQRPPPGFARRPLIRAGALPGRIRALELSGSLHQRHDRAAAPRGRP